MVDHKPTRRTFLKRLTSACALGMVASFNASAAFAKQVGDALSRIKGTVIRKTDKFYEDWRQGMTWYVRIPKRYPDTMILAQSVEDVIEAVKYARERDLKVSIRSTGHSISASPLRDDSVMIDLSQLREVSFDVENQTAWLLSEEDVMQSSVYELGQKRGELTMVLIGYEEWLERSLTERQRVDTSADLLAETEFALARALSSAAPDASAGETRESLDARARALADEARAAYVTAGEDYRGEREQVERWIAASAG